MALILEIGRPRASLLLMNEDIKEYKIKAPSSMLFANWDIKEYAIQVPSSMTLLQNAPFDIVSPCMDSNQRCPSKGVWVIFYCYEQY